MLGEEVDDAAEGWREWEGEDTADDEAVPVVPSTPLLLPMPLVLMLVLVLFPSVEEKALRPLRVLQWDRVLSWRPWRGRRRRSRSPPLFLLLLLLLLPSMVATVVAPSSMATTAMPSSSMMMTATAVDPTPQQQPILDPRSTDRSEWRRLPKCPGPLAVVGQPCVGRALKEGKD